LTPVFREISARGLFYVDDGTSARSVAMTLAPEQDLAAARADIVIDRRPNPARSKRPSRGSKQSPATRDWRSGLRASVETIGRFARALEARGIALVPLSAAMPKLQHGVAEQQP
jgi:uncharacterized protein